MGYIYLIKEREFIKTNENIIKIGKTSQKNNKRFSSYPRDSILILQIWCDEVDRLEKKLILMFCKYFKQVKTIGNEYFKGDYVKMQDIILQNVHATLDVKEVKKENNNVVDDYPIVIKDKGTSSEAEYTTFNEPLLSLHPSMIKFLKGNEKDRLIQAPIIANLYKRGLGFKDQTIKFISDYFKDQHYEKIDIDSVFSNDDFISLRMFKKRSPKLNVCDVLFKKCNSMSDFQTYEKLILDDRSKYKDLNRKTRMKLLRDQKYRFIDMNSVKGKLSDEKLHHLKQNVNLTDKIKNKYFTRSK